jgi:hypothetical protein
MEGVTIFYRLKLHRGYVVPLLVVQCDTEKSATDHSSTGSVRSSFVLSNRLENLGARTVLSASVTND